MCHTDDSRPPRPPRNTGGGLGEHGSLTLRGEVPVNCYYSSPINPAHAGVVILPDVRGLHDYYVELTKCFAHAGLAAVAIDWFTRTAGKAAPSDRPKDFDISEHIQAVTPEAVDADTAAAIASLRQIQGARIPIVAVGFCFGASHAWRQAASDIDLAACIGFYGRPTTVGAAADAARRRTLMLIAGSDEATPVHEQLELAERMRRAGARVTHAVYEGAPHSFFDRHFDRWASQCDDAWRRIFETTDSLLTVSTSTNTRSSKGGRL